MEEQNANEIEPKKQQSKREREREIDSYSEKKNVEGPPLFLKKISIVQKLNLRISELLKSD